MNETQAPTLSRKNVAIRLLYTILYLIIFEILKSIIWLTSLFQFAYLFIALKHCEPVRRFGNKVATYSYRVIRYLTLNENPRPFPFAEFPGELEPPEDPVSFE